MRALRNIRIRNKLFVAYSTLFLVAFAVAGSIIYFQVRNIIRQSIESELSRTTQTILSMVSTSADASILNYIRAVADKNLEVAKNLHREVLRGRLTDMQAKQRAAHTFLSQSVGKTGHVYCLNSDGVMVLHPKRSYMGLDMTGLYFVQKQIEQKEGYLEYDWKEPLAKKARPKAVFMRYFEPWDWIITANAFRDEFSKLIRIEDFRQRILKLGFGKTGYPFVMDYQGNLVIHPSLQGMNCLELKEPAQREVCSRIAKEKNGHFEYGWRNPGETEYRDKLVYFNDIPELGWIVASTSYHEDFYAPLDAIGYVVVTALAVMLLLMVPISFGIGELISRPLRQLQDKFAQGAAGDFSQRMPATRRDEIGVLSGYFNNFMDRLSAYSDELRTEITVRHQAEKEIKRYQATLEERVEQRTRELDESQRTLFTLMSNLPGMAYRRKSNPIQPMEFASMGAVDLLGFRPDELTGDSGVSLSQLIFPEDWPHVKALILEAIEAKAPFEALYRIRTKQGALRWVWEKGQAVYSQQGAPMAIEGFISDITDLKQSKEELEEIREDLEIKVADRTRDLEEANRNLVALDKAKTLFLSSASHELRTPLTSIIGFLKLIEKNFSKQILPHLEGTDAEGKRAQQFVDNLAVVRSEADRLGILVNDLLDLNKIESGRMEWRDQTLSVDTVLTRAAEATSTHAAENPDLRFELEIPADAMTVHADADRIHQVLLNLLSNAFKYTDQGTVTLEALQKQDVVEFSVRDTGRGISKDDTDKIFDLFYQVQDENMRSSKVFGTGLGLAICRQIVTHYGGEITVESTQGEGSRFSFTIPSAS